MKLRHLFVEGGDNKYASIAAASILAKVSRDNYIEELKPEEIKRFAIAQDKITTDHELCKSYPDKDARKFAIDQKGYLYTFSADKIHKLEGKKWKTWDLSKHFSKINIYKLYFFGNEIWFTQSNECQARKSLQDLLLGIGE